MLLLPEQSKGLEAKLSYFESEKAELFDRFENLEQIHLGPKTNISESGLPADIGWGKLERVTFYS